MSHGSALLTGGRLPAPAGAPALTPYVRHFGGNPQYVKFGKGAISGPPQKWGTLACLVRRNENGVWHGVWQMSRADENTVFQMEVMDNNLLYMDQDAGASFAVTASLSFTTADNWAVIGWTKDTGFVKPTFFKNVLGGAFTTEVGNNDVHNCSSTVTHIDVGRWWDGANADWAVMDYAKCAFWEDVVLTSTQLQTLDDSNAAWAALSPTWAVTFNQASIATLVPDDTGGGGGQIAVTADHNTSVVTTGPALPGYGA